MSILEKIPNYIKPLDRVNPSERCLVGGKAINLAHMIRAGLPIPAGYAVTTEAFDYFIANKRLPEQLVPAIETLRTDLGGKVAIRSSATCEDGATLSMAGVFNSHYVVEPNQVAGAIEDIYSNTSSPEVADYLAIHRVDQRDVRMGLVVQRLIEPDIAGVIYTGVNSDQLLIQYTNGFGAELVDGTTHGHSLLTDRNGQIITSSRYNNNPTFRKTIAKLAQTSNEIERLFGEERQDIEFACQQNRVYVVQARALTREMGVVAIEETPEETLENTKEQLKDLVAQEKAQLGTDKVIFSDSNFSELMPHPTEMDIGIFKYIFTGSEGVPGAIQLGRREMGYLLGNESVGYMHYIGGRPYFSIAKDASTFYIGIPATPKEYFQTLVPEYLDAIKEDPSKGAYPEMGLFLQDPTIEDLQLRFGDKANDYYGAYQSFLVKLNEQAETSPVRDLQSAQAQKERYGAVGEELYKLPKDANQREIVDYIKDILEHLRTASCVDFVKSARLGFYYSQKLQAELGAYVSPDQVEIFFGKLTGGLLETEITVINSRIATDQDPHPEKSVGHFSEGEALEIHHPRFKDDPNALKAYIEGLQNSDYANGNQKAYQDRIVAEEAILGKLDPGEREQFKKLLENTQRFMSIRETVKYHFTKEYSYIRDALEMLQENLGLEKGDIYFVDPRELDQLILDPTRFKSVIHSRKQAFSNYQQLNLPPVIREEDIDTIDLKHNGNGAFVETKGKFLAEGPALTGIIINLNDFEHLDQAADKIRAAKDLGQSVILVAAQMNLGHDPLIALSDGLILQNAGIVSHGAQRARELGKGALSGINIKSLTTGMTVYFDTKEKIVRKIEKDEND